MRYVKRNNFNISDEDAVNMSEHFKLSPIISKFLLSRGFYYKKTESFLGDNINDITPNYDLPNCDIACERIEEAMMTGEKIAVFGDYDADGICGTSIVVNAFKSFGYDDIFYYIPHRISEGYGLNNDAIDLFAEQGCSILITVDCGISNIEEINYAIENGIDVIVTDHHLPGEALPQAIIVNPKLSNDESQHNLCGAAVAMKLMCVLFDDGIYYESCDLAAIATVADMVDLTGENRALVKMGLRKINQGTNKNIEFLVKECFENKKEIKADDISYTIAPTINAAGRIDAADKCVELFTGASSLPQETAAILAHDNYNRRKIEKDTFLSAIEKIKDLDLSKTKSIILYDESWHQGVLGIAASKIKNRYHRPVILFTLNGDELVGSARSIDGINIHEAIDSCKEYVSHFGGHFMAAGLSLSPENLANFKNSFENCLEKYDNTLFIPKLEYDIKASTSDIDSKIIEDIEKLEPFGKGNKAPVFLLKNITVSDYKKIGSDKNHFRCTINNEVNKIPAVAFSNNIILEDTLKYDAIISVQKNEWNGRISVQAQIHDIKTSNESINDFYKNKNDRFNLSISQGLYGNKQKEYIMCDYTQLREIASKCLFSNLILAVDKDSVINIKNQIPDVYESFDVRFSYIEEEKVNYNTLVIAPDFEMLKFIDYDNIFVISNFDISNMFNSLRPKGKVYIISDNKKMNRDFNLNVNRLREIFVNLKQSILAGNFLEFIEGSDNIKLWEARAALRIFRECGLVKYNISDKKIMLTNKNKADITKSETYIKMQAGN